MEIRNILNAFSRKLLKIKLRDMEVFQILIEIDWLEEKKKEDPKRTIIHNTNKT